MAEAENLTLVMLRDLRSEVRRVREERVEDRRLLLRIHEEMSRTFAEVRGDLLLLDNRLLNLQAEILELKRHADAHEPAGGVPT